MKETDRIFWGNSVFVLGSLLGLTLIIRLNEGLTATQNRKPTPWISTNNDR